MPVHGNHYRKGFALARLPFCSNFCRMHTCAGCVLGFKRTAIFSHVFPIFSGPSSRNSCARGRVYQRPKGCPRGERGAEGRGGLGLHFCPRNKALVHSIPIQITFRTASTFNGPISISNYVLGGRGRIISAFQADRRKGNIFACMTSARRMGTRII